MTARNYQITGLVNHGDHYTVETEVGGRRRDSGERPSEWGLWGLTRAERGILRRGLTPAGRDRRPRR